ncbi:PadR family transcriptional regulator [Sphingomonas sp. AR_OL41]|uniref:PadR family transcriptional regulator n=1 Tax=Sphingomonas sp. AR_OL41 TaxID=3042729 RepID=UPI002480306B|nr:PadR family transcriptional regulator [Sphingomonas sp. AR_OL41]MDH7971218.1 PadR family transcriptional regulator [Sphingomonas sp. AR_OL41]
MAVPVEEDQFEKMRIELRRGSLVLAVLGALREERYGYTLRKSLEDAGLPIDEGALYPLLRRLEAQGLLESEWREEAKRNKRFYRLNPEGEAIFAQLLGEWNAISESILRLNGGKM